MMGEMSCRRDRTLTVSEAAEIIYRTNNPTATQVRRVQDRLECGALKGRKSADQCWRSTTAFVAEYMAGQAYLRQLADGSGPREDGLPGDRARQDRRASRKEYAPLRTVYEQLLRDYFLAIIFRRRARHNTKAFRWAVSIGQAAILMLIVSLSVAPLRPVCRAILSAAPPEQAIVERWLADQEHEFNVTRWHPAVPSPDEDGVSVRVQYSYATSGGKTIDTDRVFLIKDGRVLSVSSSP